MEIYDRHNKSPGCHLDFLKTKKLVSYFMNVQVTKATRKISSGKNKQKSNEVSKAAVYAIAVPVSPILAATETHSSVLPLRAQGLSTEGKIEWEVGRRSLHCPPSVWPFPFCFAITIGNCIYREKVLYGLNFCRVGLCVDDLSLSVELTIPRGRGRRNE